MTPPSSSALHGFAMFIGYIIAIVINCFFVWLALLISRLKASFKGMLMLSAAVILPYNLFPGIVGGIGSLILVAIVVRNVTDAEGWGDSLKYIGATFLISLGLLFLLLSLVDINKLQNQGASAPVEQAETAGSSDARPNSAYDAMKNQLSPAELAEIEKQVSQPIKK